MDVLHNPNNLLFSDNLLLTTISGKRGQFFLKISVQFDCLNGISVFCSIVGWNKAAQQVLGFLKSLFQDLPYHSIPHLEFMEVWSSGKCPT